MTATDSSAGGQPDAFIVRSRRMFTAVAARRREPFPAP